MSLMVMLYNMKAIFSENDLLSQVTRTNFRTITFVEGVELLHMYKSQVNAMQSEGLDAFFGENYLLTSVTTIDPG